MSDTERDTLRLLLDRIDGQRARAARFQQAWKGEQPAAYLSKKSRESLDSRLNRLSVNAPRLVVKSVCERLSVTGFRRDDGEHPDPALWDRWRAAGMVGLSDLIHTDRALYGAAYVTVWGGDDGTPVVTGDNPRTMAVDLDPATGETLSAVRRWNSLKGSHAVVFDGDKITRWNAGGQDTPAGSGAWTADPAIDNPFGVVPVVPFVRSTSTDDVAGTSLVADVLDLSDALGKVLQDALVTSEYFARPRRWATGLEVEEDDDGNAIDPFANDRKLVSEAPDTKFGQFDASGVDGYTDLTATFWQQIGALTGLPPHYLGLHGDQPANADGVRAAEAQLASGAFWEQRQMDGPWGDVSTLLEAIATNTDPAALVPSTPLWRSPEIRTPAQAADAAAKLSGIGVPLRSLLVDPLGYDPATADRIVAAARAERLDQAGTDLARLLR